MSIGYACLTVGVFGVKQRTCMIKNASPDVLLSLTQSNLKALDKIMDYNIKNNIRLFRISSDIIPFGSHPVNTLNWREIFGNQLKEIGNKALSAGIRLSMHPGQYTVLNSPNDEVVKRAVDDLKYHSLFLDALGLGKEHKIILHIGGIYGDKAAATGRFIQQYSCLDNNIKSRLVIENDDRQYNISDVLSIGFNEGIPVVFDILHHMVNTDNTRPLEDWILSCKNTWKPEDGAQKIHYSQQEKDKRPGSHSTTLNAYDFSLFYNNLPVKDTDIMVEVKDKNLSAIKCINAISAPEIQRLEEEWARYKYKVLEHSPKAYSLIIQLLKEKNAYPFAEFYRLIDEALKTPVKPSNAVNAAGHVWSYVEDLADKKTKISFEKSLDKVSEGGSPLQMKRMLLKLAIAGQQRFLLNSLYFMELY